MDSVLDKEHRLSEGHSGAEDRNMDLEDLTDDDEVALNLPRKRVEERDPPDDEIRELLGTTVSGAPVTQQDEWFRMEPLHGTQPKWNRPGRPTLVMEEPGGLGAEATGCMVGLEAKESSGSTAATASPGYAGGRSSNTPEEGC